MNIFIAAEHPPRTAKSRLILSDKDLLLHAEAIALLGNSEKARLGLWHIRQGCQRFDSG
ncbi:hypothetical protein [Paenarthrobacter sp. NPDC090522]|uniref:hypothetical protein n=1 Tax=Paenarthrobacter sp. NPDC090522 TaxID=3364383 RepID=UPI00382340B6